MSEDDPKWKAIDALRNKVSQHDQQIASLTYEQRLMREQYDRLFAQVKANGRLLETVHNDVATAKVGLAIGRWLTSTSFKLISAVVAGGGLLLAWMKLKG